MRDRAHTPAEQRAMLLSMLRGALGDQRFTYLSGPITTGSSFIHWQRSIGGGIAEEADWREARANAVIAPNCAALFAAAAALRDSGRPVIEPGSFETGSRIWRQYDYYQLWDQVITRHASDIRFLDGWSCSAGCVYEFLCALKYGRPTLTIDGSELPKASAIAQIDEALASLHDDDPKLSKLRDDIISFRGMIEAS